jgi:PEP-CTERM motif-containing protein
MEIKMRNQVSISSIVAVLLVSLLSAGSVFGVIIDVTSPREGFDIEAATTYNLLLNGLTSPAISNGTLRVTEHWGDFNNDGSTGTVNQVEWVNISIDGIVLATQHVYFNDNGANNREVDLFYQLSQADMNSIVLAGGNAIVNVTTSIDVDNSLVDSWFEAEISYEVIPEPATMMLFGLGGVLLRRRKKA